MDRGQMSGLTPSHSATEHKKRYPLDKKFIVDTVVLKNCEASPTRNQNPDSPAFQHIH